MSAESSAAAAPLATTTGRKVVGNVLVLAGESVVIWFAVAWVGVETVRAYQASLVPTRVWSGVMLEDVDLSHQVSAQVRQSVHEVSQRRLLQGIEIRANERSLQLSAGELGLRLADQEAQDAAMQAGRSGDFIDDLKHRRHMREKGLVLPLRAEFDEDKALQTLSDHAPDFESAHVPARIDFAARQVVAAQAARWLDPHTAAMQVAQALQGGQRAINIDLHTRLNADVEVPPVTARDLAVTIAAYETNFSSDASTRDRVHNLRIAAQALDGAMIGAGATFSFNEAVGERSFELGYRQAPGINGGELVDVVGGGVCQVASTMFAAGFMGGLEVVRSVPHSRPSAYIELGLDTTVVWPTIDLVLRNPYDFPLVVHTLVQAGKVRVELLAREPGARVIFSRTITGEAPFSRTERSDPGLLDGAVEIKQRGSRGYFVTRWREIFRGSGDEPIRERWDLTYPPTEEIALRGTAAKGRTPAAPPFAKPVPEQAVALESTGGQAIPAAVKIDG